MTNYNDEFALALIKDNSPRRVDPRALSFVEKTVFPRYKARHQAPPFRILEIAPGLSTLFAQENLIHPALEVLSLDLSEVAVDFLKSQELPLGEKHQIRTQDILALDDSDGFDLIIDLSLLHCLESKKQQSDYFEVVKKHLRPHGLFYFQTMVVPKFLSLEDEWYFDDFTGTVFYQDRPHRLLNDAFEIEKNLNSRGFLIDYFRVSEDEKFVLSKQRHLPMARDPDLLRVIAGLANP